MERQAPTTSTRWISLIEVLLVIVVLSADVGALGIRGISALREHRFEAAVNEIVSKLDLAQHLMLCCRANVQLRIDRSDRRYVLRLVTDDELPDRFAAAIAGEKILRGIDRLTFEGREELPLDLPFNREAAQRMPRGTLTLASPSQTLVHIPLPGHFTQITKHYGDYTQSPELQAPPFPEEVLQAALPAA